MKIEKLPSGTYRVRVMVDGVRYSLSFDKEPTEKAINKKLAEKIAAAPVDKVDKGSFEYYANKYISIQDNVLSPTTARSYSHIVKVLSDDFKKKQLKNITQEDITAEVNRLMIGRKPKTVRNYHGFISSIFKMYRPSFALHTKLPQKVKPNKRVPYKDEVKEVLNYVKGTRYYIPYKLAVYGLRRGEICAITADDLSEDNILTINKDLVYTKDKKWVIKNFPKTTESERKICIDQELADMLRKQGYAYNGHPSRLYDYLRVVEKNLGIEHFRLHDFRGYMVTELSQANYSDADIMSFGGWKTDYVMKEHYRQSRIQNDLEKQKKMQKVLL